MNLSRSVVRGSVVRGSVVRGMVLGLAAAAALSMAGCTDPESKRPSATQPVIRHASLGLRNVPDYLKGTLYEQTNLMDTQPRLVSGFGLVVHLRRTGDNSAIPTPVREHMVKELQRHGFGTHRAEGFEKADPERILRDPTTAVVRVDGYVPPGARKGDNFDVLVSALEESYTKSLSHGTLYQTDLTIMGGNPNDPGSSVNVYARAWGPVFVNPTYALVSPKNIDTTAQMSSRYGVIIGGGASRFDNPLVLRVRVPDWRVVRTMQFRINQRFQDQTDHTIAGRPSLAEGVNEAMLNLYVPRVYRGNWEHFAGVVQHLYMNSSPGYLAQKAVELQAAAKEPNAPLENISYALEGIGLPAAAVCVDLMKHPSADVQYAAARALAFIGDDDNQARDLLLTMARTKDHPFQVAAVKTLADMPDTLETAQYLRQLVSSENAAVRIAAYKALASSQDSLVSTKVIQEKFALDLVPSSGPPMIYASRRGVPRIAFFGTRQALRTPMLFSALDARLMLNADKSDGPVTIFYRSEKSQGDPVNATIRQYSRPGLAEIIARLGGESSPEEPRLDFSYADIVALLQSLQSGGKLVATSLDGQEQPIVLQIEEQTAHMADSTNDAPRIPDVGRQDTDGGESNIPRIPDPEDAKDQPADQKARPN